MKESRLIIIVMVILMILTFPFLIIYHSNNNIFNIITNIYCGYIVGLITSLCQYYSLRNKAKNDIYNCYFDVYRSYYYCMNNNILGHHNIIPLNDKLISSSMIANGILDDYHGLLFKKDKLYYKLNPVFNSNLKIKDFTKNNKLFNRKSINKSYGVIIDKYKEILCNINEKRFNKDNEDMINVFNKLYDKNQ